jgi:hypothetical protein
VSVNVDHGHFTGRLGRRHGQCVKDFSVPADQFSATRRARERAVIGDGDFVTMDGVPNLTMATLQAQRLW